MRTSRFWCGGALVVLAALGIGACSTTSSGSTSSTTTTSAAGPQEIRDVRYCEVIPSVQQGSTVTTDVYNTLGFNYCPPDKWNKLTEAEVNQEYGSQSAKLNGPRHWVIDSAQSLGGNSSSTKTFTFGGIETGLKGVVTTQANQPTVGDQLYTPNQVSRDTVWTYKSGKPVFELTGPDGSVYVMQSYAQIGDKTLTYQQLPDLGSKLQLPTGWSYKSVTLTQTLNLNSNGLATVVNDNLYDSYQKM
jgi:hypothetical protein